MLFPSFRRFENSRNVEITTPVSLLWFFSDDFAPGKGFAVACLLLTQYSLLLPMR